MKNAIAEKVKIAVESKVEPAFKKAFDKIIIAGLKVMHSPETRKMTEKQMMAEGDPIENAAEGVAKLLILLFAESKNTMSMKAGIPAAQVLLLEGMEDMEELGLLEVNNQTISDATEKMMAYILQLLGIDKSKMGEYMKAGSQVAKEGAPNAPNAANAGGGIIQGAQ